MSAKEQPEQAPSKQKVSALRRSRSRAVFARQFALILPMIGDGVDKFLTNLDGGEDANPYLPEMWDSIQVRLD